MVFGVPDRPMRKNLDAAVVANAHAAAAYLLGAERLFENEPKVEIGELAVGEADDGGALGITRPTMTVAVTVMDGEEAVKCAAEKVKSMFEATSDLGLSENAGECS